MVTTTICPSMSPSPRRASRSNKLVQRHRYPGIHSQPYVCHSLGQTPGITENYGERTLSAAPSSTKTPSPLFKFLLLQTGAVVEKLLPRKPPK